MNLKKFGQKLMAILIILFLLQADFALCGVGISSVIAENSKIPETEVALENLQYVQFANQEFAGVAVRTMLTVETIQQQEDCLPKIASEIDINLPDVNGVYPEKIRIIKANAVLVSGDKNSLQVNQNYDQDSGLLCIDYEIKNIDDQIVKDEFEIIYIYSSNAYTGNDEEIKLNYEINSKISYKTDESILTSNNKEKITLTQKENIGDLSVLELTDITSDLYKGFMYSNTKNNTNYETEFTTVSNLSVINSESIDSLSLKINEPLFVLNDDEQTEILAGNFVNYKNIKFEKSDFNNILGEDGYIEIYNEDELFANVKYLELDDSRKLSVIYSNDNVDFLEDNDYITINLENGLSDMLIKTSKPITEDVIEITNDCVIKASKNYGVKTEKIAYIKIGETANDYTTNSLIKLQEPEAKITFDASNTSFSTLESNKTTLTIKLDDTNSSAKLFENPSIEITLPEGIEYGNISIPKILYDNGLQIKNATSNDNIIKIELEGQQNEYDIKNIAGGTIICIDIDNLCFNKTVATHEDEIKVKCVNLDEEIVKTVKVNIKSAEGTFIYSTLSGYDNDDTIKELEKDNTNTIKIESFEEQMDLKNSFILVNNNENSIDDLCITNILDFSFNADEKSTFLMNLQKEIEISNEDVTIQYIDENKKLTSDFSESTIGYRISFSHGIKPGESFSYDAFSAIPEKVGDDAVNYSIVQFVYYYDGNQIVENYSIKMASNETLKNREESVNEISAVVPKEGEVSIQLEEIKIGDKYITEETELMQGQTVKYKYKITNNTENNIDNMKIKTTIKNAKYYEIVDSGEIFNEEGETAHYWQEVEKEDGVEEITINSLKANESTEYEYQVVVNEDTNNTVNTIELINANSEIIDKKEIVNSVKEASLKLKVEYAKNEEKEVGAEEQFILSLIGKNISNNKLKKVNVSVYLPEELNFNAYYNDEEFKVQTEYDSAKHLLNFTIDSIAKEQEFEILIECTVGSIDTNLLQKEIKIVSSCNINNENIISNELIRKIIQKENDIEIRQINAEIENQVIDKDIFDYEFEITNNGILEQKADITVSLDYGLIIKRAVLISDNESTELDIISNKMVSENIYLKDNITYKLLLTLQFNESDVTDKNTNKLTGKIFVVNDCGYDNYIDFNVNVKIYSEEEKEIKDIAKIIQDNEKEETDIKENENVYSTEAASRVVLKDEVTVEEFNLIIKNIENTETYCINGKAWNDENNNGIMEENEERIENLNVKVVDLSTGDFVKNVDGTIYELYTDKNGEYTFSNLTKGKYIVLFEVDTNNYSVTEYRNGNDENNIYSDAVLANVKVYGNIKKAAITNEICIDKSNENVNIGLIENSIQGTEKIKKDQMTNVANTNNEDMVCSKSNYIAAITFGIVIVSVGAYLIKKKIIEEN